MAVAVGLSGCAQIDNYMGESSGTTACFTGAAVGALVGVAVVALTKGDGKDMLVAGTAGAGVGCGVALLYQDRVQKLQAVAKQEGLVMQVNELNANVAATPSAAPKLQAVGVEAQVQSSEMFAVGSAELTPAGRRQLTLLATALTDKQADKAPATKKILVVGHTDATGSADFNQKLSEQRARAVGQILADVGIPRQNIYYQGAGASRPLANNATEQGRTENRRVEFVEVQNEQLLVERVRNERSNAKYLAHGTAPVTATKPVTSKPSSKPAVVASKPAKTSTPIAQAPAPEVKAPVMADSSPNVPLSGKGGVDFGGHPVTDTRSPLAMGITPKSSPFAIIGTANAAAPLSSCVADLPRVEGQVKSLADDKPLKEFATTEFFPGLNGKPWATAVNGHSVAVGPIAVLRDGAKVAQAPKMQLITDFAGAQKKQSPSYASVANTYEGESQILYRVFALDQQKSPLTCIDLVFDKRAGKAVAGEIYYPKQGDAYVAQFTPKRR
ncbi:OmpA family protein [Pseudomonas sp. RA_35y_Pfl2_P32]|uniref:OmpA family protein n=1 Tax=Pseudomonas sp. RA_35y_Pfl2_P32 TaxID=3088705 RepID=UPI0030D8C3B6